VLVTITTSRGLERARRAAIIYTWLGVALIAIGVALAVLMTGSFGGLFGGIAAIGLVALAFGLRGRRWVSNQRALQEDAGSSAASTD
jgi:membrane protein implicated in regulation of membrane protease activity